MKATGIKLSKETLSAVLGSCAVAGNSDTEKQPTPEIEEIETNAVFDHFSDIPIFDYDDDNIEDDDHANESNTKQNTEINLKNKHPPSLTNPELMMKKDNIGNVGNAKYNQKRPNTVNNDDIPDNLNPTIYLISQAIGFSVKNKFVTEEKLRSLLVVQPDSDSFEQK